MFPPRIEVIRDTAEKDGAILPTQVRTRWGGKTAYILEVVPLNQHLRTGDYAARGYEECSLVERKARMTELHSCLEGKDAARFGGVGGQVERMIQECRVPWLLVDTSMSAMYDRRILPFPELTVDGMLNWQMNHPLRVVWANAGTGIAGRQALGELIVRMLIAGIVWCQKNPKKGESNASPGSGGTQVEASEPVLRAVP